MNEPAPLLAPPCECVSPFVVDDSHVDAPARCLRCGRCERDATPDTREEGRP